MARDKEIPNKNIGAFLKARREQLNESLAEVSGAVEVDIDYLHRIEVGAELPSEDILILLMSHFDVAQTEAHKLLQLAGYNTAEDVAAMDEQVAKQIFMLMPFNTQVMYADDAHVLSNSNGVTITFTQPGQNGQPMPISRIGISPQLTNKLMRELSLASQPFTPKLLNAPKKSDSFKGKRV